MPKEAQGYNWRAGLWAEQTDLQFYASKRVSAKLADAGFEAGSWHVVQASQGGLYGLDEGFSSIRPDIAGDNWQAHTRHLWWSWQADGKASTWLAEHPDWWQPRTVPTPPITVPLVCLSILLSYCATLLEETQKIIRVKAA
ncbi:hypothetical protein LKL35_24240 [Streptomyces sp. ET3-23]|uniref:hypothetical protein n=1 Tax=Streptomyces sp. ET3-23 TaxID=2885643 RepID=UPI001D121D94|nr:hypothetical protein [Streptomyces sp. ET3-23]MCC2278509.1 hypothetical protein [Streptomyces sp. ET3-23]